MKLQQLRYIVEVANHELNVSLTAEKLYTSQPGISKQIKQLEDELGVQIFYRSGKHLSGITEIGKTIIDTSREILNKVQDIKMIVQEHTKPNLGMLSLSTTYTQARYALPLKIQKFMQNYPDIALKMEQAESSQCLSNLKNRVTDFAIISDITDLTEELIALPCYHWNQSIIVPAQHPLTNKAIISIEDLAHYPLISYDLSKEGSDIYQTFHKNNTVPNIVFNTADADLIKTYVRLGTGVGIIAKMAMDNHQDQDLVVLNAGHIFPYSTTYIVFLRALYLRSYMYDFISEFSPHLNRSLIHQALSYENNQQVLTMFNGMKLNIK
ncbi:LysR substrate-binding domain-containing protein [Frischella perrara]|uniref:LysR substrate-binding domain-containing protein n=1 Tax=Frischella perrara TaxID=1267021 RepID=UPI0023F47108|nr:LysR substrate-binding domain-containing protein [Frischella perrara]MCT6874726.1 LysR substrate-binding domain-containing protein [Frischella perrara]